MRVLHVSTWEVPCGIATYCANLVHSLDDHGIRNDVYPIAAHRWTTFTAGDARELLRDIASQARLYDVVHIQHEHSLFGHAVSHTAATRNYGELLRLLRAVDRPAVTTFHTVPLGSEPLGWPPSPARWIRNWNRRHAWRRHVSGSFAAGGHGARAIVHSASTRRVLVRRGMPAEAIHIIEHGCLPSRELKLDRLSAKTRLGLPPATVMVTMFGFVGRYKGHEVAIRALARMPDRYRLAICGGTHPESQDRCLASLVRLARRLGVEDRVTITGWLTEDDAALHYAATDICLAPYIDAHLAASGAITWALASGRPIIASKIPAFQEMCRKHPCMLLTTPGMADEIAWAVEKVAADDAFARRLVDAASRYVEDHSWQRAAAETESLYAAMVARKPIEAARIGPCPVVTRQPRTAAARAGQGPENRGRNDDCLPRLRAG